MFDVRGEVSRRSSSRRDDVVPARRTGPLVVGAGLVLGAVALLVLVPLLIAAPVVGALALLVAVLRRRTLADLAAGVTLLLAQPYSPGERIRLHVGRSGEVEAEVLQVRLLHTALCTGSGMLFVRNVAMLRTAPGA